MCTPGHSYSLIFSGFFSLSSFSFFSVSYLILQSNHAFSSYEVCLLSFLDWWPPVCVLTSPPGFFSCEWENRSFPAPRSQAQSRSAVNAFTSVSQCPTSGCVHCEGGIIASSFYKSSLSFILVWGGMKDWGGRDNAVGRCNRSYLECRQSSAVFEVLYDGAGLVQTRKLEEGFNAGSPAIGHKDERGIVPKPNKVGFQVSCWLCFLVKLQKCGVSKTQEKWTLVPRLTEQGHGSPEVAANPISFLRKSSPKKISCKSACLWWKEYIFFFTVENV